MGFQYIFPYVAADGVIDSCVTGSKRSNRQRHTFKDTAVDTVCLGGGGKRGFSAWFLTYFNSSYFLLHKSIIKRKYIGNQLQIEIVSYGCPLFPSKIHVQPYRIFCDPFRGFPPPLNQPPFQNKRAQSEHWARNVFKIFNLCRF